MTELTANNFMFGQGEPASADSPMTDAMQKAISVITEGMHDQAGYNATMPFSHVSDMNITSHNVNPTLPPKIFANSKASEMLVSACNGTPLDPDKRIAYTPCVFKGRGHKEIERSLIKTLDKLPYTMKSYVLPKKKHSLSAIALGTAFVVVGPPTAEGMAMVTMLQAKTSAPVQIDFNNIGVEWAVDIKNRGISSLIPDVTLKKGVRSILPGYSFKKLDDELPIRRVDNPKPDPENDNHNPIAPIPSTQGSARTLRMQQKGIKQKPKSAVLGDPPEDYDGSTRIASFRSRFENPSAGSINKGRR